MGGDPLQVLRPIRTPVVEAEIVFPIKKFTLRRTTGLLALWLLCVLMPPVALLFGCVYGAIEGAAHGMVKAIIETHRDLTRWWRMFNQR